MTVLAPADAVVWVPSPDSSADFLGHRQLFARNIERLRSLNCVLLLRLARRIEIGGWEV